MYVIEPHTVNSIGILVWCILPSTDGWNHHSLYKTNVIQGGLQT